MIHRFLVSVLLISGGAAYGYVNPPPPMKFVNNYRKYSYNKLKHEVGTQRTDVSWIGGGRKHGPPIPVIHPNVVLNSRNNTFSLKGLRTGGIYKVTVDNPIGHYGVLDFAGMSGQTILFDTFDIQDGNYLIIKNLGNNRIAGAQNMSIHNSPPNLYLQDKNIAIEVNGELKRIKHRMFGRYEWWTEWVHYEIMTPTEELHWQATAAVPEPSTYGAVFGAVGLGLAAWRRQRRTVVCATQ